MTDVDALFVKSIFMGWKVERVQFISGDLVARTFVTMDAVVVAIQLIIYLQFLNNMIKLLLLCQDNNNSGVCVDNSSMCCLLS